MKSLEVTSRACGMHQPLDTRNCRKGRLDTGLGDLGATRLGFDGNEGAQSKP
jgi:hypothetical protein